MKFIYDETNKYKELLLKHLRAHNVQFTGDKKYEEKYVYVYKEGKLKGAMKSVLSWDMVTIKSLFYDNIEVLESMLYELVNLFKDCSSNMMVKLFEKQRMNDFELLGFSELGRIIGTEKVLDDVTYIYNKQKYTKHYDVLSGAGIDQFNTILDKNFTIYNNVHSILDNDFEMGVAAFEGETYLGGIIGQFKKDQMYIDLLTTTVEARGKKVGTALMRELEKYAKEQGVHNIHVGTAEFQAKPFYEKLGYKVRITFENYPKGYKCYELQKMI